MHLRLLYTLLCCSLVFASCKKDRLHFSKLQRIDTYTTHRLNQILFINDTLGFICGGERFEYADLLTTYDGGKTWTHRDFPDVAKAFYGMTQAPSGVLYMTAFDGKFLYSRDTGKTWTFKQLHYTPIKKIVYPDNTHGIVIGGISYDDGLLWRVDDEGNITRRDSVAYELNDISFADAQNGFMVGAGVVLRTGNGGVTWDLVGPHNDNFKAIDRHGAQLVYICGIQGSIYKTEDGGFNWIELRNGNDLTQKKYHLNSILFVDGLNGFAVGDEGVLIYSDDGGQHWMEFDPFTSVDLQYIAKAPDGSLLVAGSGGVLYRLER